MRKTLILLILFFTSIGWAQRAQVVAPNGLDNVEGNSSATDPFTSTSFRFQQVFDASQFGIAGGATARIDRILFRVDGDATEDVLLFFGGGTVSLSTTQLGPDELSPFFEDNRGVDSVNIWNGAMSFSGDPPIGAAPAPFNEVIPVTTPFFYIPSQGNLLLDVAGFGGQAFLPGSLDAQSVTGDGVSWVWSRDGNSISGVAETLGLVTRFDITVVPEPAALVLLLAGLGFLGVLRPR